MKKRMKKEEWKKSILRSFTWSLCLIVHPANMIEFCLRLDYKYRLLQNYQIFQTVPWHPYVVNAPWHHCSSFRPQLLQPRTKALQGTAQSEVHLCCAKPEGRSGFPLPPHQSVHQLPLRRDLGRLLSAFPPRQRWAVWHDHKSCMTDKKSCCLKCQRNQKPWGKSALFPILVFLHHLISTKLIEEARLTIECWCMSKHQKLYLFLSLFVFVLLSSFFFSRLRSLVRACSGVVEPSPRPEYSLLEIRRHATGKAMHGKRLLGLNGKKALQPLLKKSLKFQTGPMCITSYANSMKAILACHPAPFIKWLYKVAILRELWRVRTDLILIVWVRMVPTSQVFSISPFLLLLLSRSAYSLKYNIRESIESHR